MAFVGPSKSPGVMVSSTFFDLRQVREDLRRFLLDIGCQPFVSEHSSFPVTPDVSAIENCRLRVERDADILVLVLGTRYGSINERTGRSVTSDEYFAARQKGIPIYALFDKALAAAIPLWRRNPDADFSGYVDDPRIFDFADRVQRTDGVWKFEFEYVHEIAGYLRTQLGFLFGEALASRRLLRSRGELAWVGGLEGEALRLALMEPEGWELLLLGQVLSDAVRQHSRLRRQQQFGVTLARGEDVGNPLRWSRRRLRDVRKRVTSAAVLVQGWCPSATGNAEVPASGQEIVLVAQSLGDFYRALVEWSLSVRAANLPGGWKRLQRILSRMADETIVELENFGPQIVAATKAELAKPINERGGLDLRLRAWIPDARMARFRAELQRLREKGAC